MVYLYFNREEKILYAYDTLTTMRDDLEQASWDNIETVTADHENGQIVAHEMGTGKVIEFPIGLTMLSCKAPININK